MTNIHNDLIIFADLNIFLKLMNGIPSYVIGRLLLSVAAMMATVASWAVSPYPQLDLKVSRAFDYGEWASASAMLDLMLEQKPDVPATYGRAIVANGMREATDEQLRLLAKALDNHIAFDSVFSNVEMWSSQLGRPHIYEKFLVDTRVAYPWMRRTINATLLKYYTFHDNGREMVEYAGLMLEGAPDNEAFLGALAAGYMLTDSVASGLDTYRRILSLNPDNYEALLALGNWYAVNPAGDENGRVFLERAYAIRPTPFVAKLLAGLRGSGR